MITHKVKSISYCSRKCGIVDNTNIVLCILKLSLNSTQIFMEWSYLQDLVFFIFWVFATYDEQYDVQETGRVLAIFVLTLSLKFETIVVVLWSSLQNILLELQIFFNYLLVSPNMIEIFDYLEPLIFMLWFCYVQGSIILWIIWIIA